MRSRYLFAVLAAGMIAHAHDAHAHGFAGDHMFVSTLIIDDPNVSDEASLPTFSYLPQPTNGGSAPGLYAMNVEFDKRITENFGFGLNSGYNWLTRPGDKTATGFSHLLVTLKYNFGKGFGDLPIGWLRPLALTGELGYTIADKKLKIDPADGSALNNGRGNAWTGGLSLQYSLRYLSSQVKDYGLPTFVNRLTPLVEVAWSSPASKPNGGDVTRYLVATGLNYTAQSYAVSVEALIPGNKQTGSHLGVVAQFHLYFDDMFPNTLGKPIAQWF